MRAGDILLRFLRVPQEPHAPVGDEDVQVFRAAPNFLKYQLLKWLGRTAAASWGLIIAFGMSSRYGDYVPASMDEWAGAGIITLITVVEMIALAGVVIQAAVSLMMLPLDFDQRWYVISDRSLRTREGLIRLHEKTMTYANVQHVSIRQGPIQRMFGIADLEIRTAGGGGSVADEKGEAKDNMHIGYMRGLDNASEVRDIIRERLRRHRDSGLGDPDDQPAHAAHVAQALHEVPPLLDAARILADEARALRRALRPALPTDI